MAWPTRHRSESPVASSRTVGGVSRRARSPVWGAVGRGLRLGGVALLTALVLLLALLPPLMASRALHPPRAVGTSTPGVPYEDVTFAGQAGALHGWYVPGASDAAIVLLHGFLSDRRELLDLVPALRAAGYHLLLYDQRGAGVSDGDGVTFGYYEAGDMAVAADLLRQRSGATRVGVLGASQGAATALLAAAQRPDLAAVVADSAFADLEAVARDGAARLYGPMVATFSAALSPLILWHAERQSGLRAAAVRPVAAIPQLSPRSVLLIHGMDDWLFSYHHSETLYAAAGEPRALWLVPGAAHAGARAREPDEYRRRVLEFFAAALAPAPPGG
jgi:uncharacterized protein